jgi:spore coat protein U-like protein
LESHNNLTFPDFAVPGVISMKFSKTALSTLSVAVVGFMALGIASTPAVAATQTATFAVTATVQGTCTISATALAFGIYTGTALPATSTVTVNCTGGTIYNVGLNPGTATGATVTTRKMKGQYTPANTLGYSLYSDSGRTTNWGQTIGTDTVAGIGNGANQPLTVYGQIPTGTAPAADSYSDTITATVTY